MTPTEEGREVKRTDSSTVPRKAEPSHWRVPHSQTYRSGLAS